MFKPDTSEILNADNLEDLEAHALADGEGTEGVTYAPAVTLPDAVETLRRNRYHLGAIDDIHAQADALIAPLQAQIDQVRAWAREQIKDREQRITLHEGRLRVYYEANLPAKGRTIKLPGGKLIMRAQQPEWLYPDDLATTDALLAELTDLALVRVRVEPDKAGVKKAGAILPDGQVAVLGIVLPGVRVQPRPDKFVVEVDG